MGTNAISVLVEIIPKNFVIAPFIADESVSLASSPLIITVILFLTGLCGIIRSAGSQVR
jgi:hypothetical protein